MKHYRYIAFSILSLLATVLLSAQTFECESDLRRHVRYLSSEDLGGRKAGTAGESMSAEYLFSRLEEAGVIMLTDEQGQDFTIKGEDGDIHSLNIVGIVEGYDPMLRNEYIVVGANFDNVGTNEMMVNGKSHLQVYPGADRNASGVATLIELARNVASCSFLFRRSIIFVGFGAGEMGMAGSWYFANRAFEGMPQVKSMIDLDMLGGEGDGMLKIYSSISAARLESLMDMTADEPVVSAAKVLSQEINQSDYLPFYDKGLPVYMFTTGRTKDAGTVRDTPDRLSYGAMERNCNYIFYFLKVLACLDNVPGVVVEQDSSSENPEDHVYAASDCDVRPQFFHSDEVHFLETWVYKYLKYPMYAITSGIQGQVLVSFIVEKDGRVTNVKVVRGIDQDLDEEAVKVVSISPKWIAGQVRGRKVRTKIVLPVEFRLKK